MVDHEISGAKEWSLEEEKPPNPQTSAVRKDEDDEPVDTDRVVVPKIPTGPRAERNEIKVTIPSAPISTSTRTFRLPISFGHFKERAAEYINGLGAGGGSIDDFLFEKINQETGAFIPQPKKFSEQWLQIWGDPVQVATARSALIRLIDRCLAQGPSKKKKEDFAKVYSYSASKEARLDQIDKHSIVIEQLRRKPDPSLEFSESLLFLWPTDEVPLDLALGSELEALDPIRRETGCCIYIYDEQPSFIKVDGDDHEKIITVVNRLRAKWVEVMAKIHIQAKLYLVQSASAQVRKNEVAVVRVAHSVGGIGHTYATPVLYGTPLTAMKLDFWHEQEENAAANNERRLCETIEESLYGIQFLRGHVRMRVNFGTFILDDYRMPKGSRARYTFDEFRTMLLNPRTRGHLVPGLEYNCGDTNLVAKCASASHILTNLHGPHEAPLEQPEPLYSANFEFQGNETLLRLEVEFKKSSITNEYGLGTKRWIHPQGEDRTGDRRPPLQVAVIDFERSDWQLEIKALEFPEQSTFEQSLKEFWHSLHFKPEEIANLSGPGKKRVSFSNRVPIARHVEKSALQYRLKGTKYIFELARYDEYRRVQLSAAQLLLQGPNTNYMPTTPVTSWGASIFHPEWDNELGKHANLQVGQKADWCPNLKTFFPLLGDADPSDLRSGFDSFMPLVKQVASLLGPEHEKDLKNKALEQGREQTTKSGEEGSSNPSTSGVVEPIEPESQVFETQGKEVSKSSTLDTSSRDIPGLED
ncbi:uncharacterized protein GIQ15_05473 [Arthroderma uncinatum]|uniref:uncharacterized protein n=1 Tax=Arthroderma uncinatum TaxID=74035 RepID=UPI00144A9CE8|nr:uncharacterized protein GIQ15_05473 [Arthroderma uncinatum]KAF3480126.1 hypothetical protein GIQ15_05473 [Arthroderma uncinatum]